MPLPAIAGALAAAAVRAAGSTIVKRVIVGTAVYYGANAAVRQAAETAADTAESVGQASKRAMGDLVVPAIVGYLIYTQLLSGKRRRR